jgi:hypothetical protein
VQADDAPGNLEERRRIGRREVFAFAQAEEQRHAAARDDQPVRVGLVEHRDRVGAGERARAGAHGVEQSVAGRDQRMHEVRDHFSLRCRCPT